MVLHGTPYPVDPAALAAIYAGPSREEIITYGQKEISNLGPEGGFVIADYTQIKDSFSEAERATIDLECYLAPLSPITPGRVDINRLRTLFSLRKFKHWGPDAVYKAFDDLDQALFDGKLQHQCKLRWRKEADSVENGTVAYSYGTTALYYRTRKKEPNHYYKDLGTGEQLVDFGLLIVKRTREKSDLVVSFSGVWYAYKFEKSLNPLHTLNVPSMDS